MSEVVSLVTMESYTRSTCITCITGEYLLNVQSLNLPGKQLEQNGLEVHGTRSSQCFPSPRIILCSRQTINAIAWTSGARIWTLFRFVNNSRGLFRRPLLLQPYFKITWIVAIVTSPSPVTSDLVFPMVTRCA